MNVKLKSILDRAETWPKAAQDELAQLALEIEAELGGTYDATPEELKAIDQGLSDLDAGRFVTQEQAMSVFAKFRQK